MRLRVAIPLLAVLSLAGAAAGARMVERDLEDRVATALAARGVTSDSVTFDGTDGVIRGAAASRSAALAAASDVSQAGEVRFEAVAIPPTPAPRPVPAQPLPDTPAPPVVDFVVGYDGSTVSLSGAVAATAQREALVAAAAKVVGEKQVVDRLTVGTTGSTEVLDRSVSEVARLIPSVTTGMSRADLRLQGEQLRLTGTSLPGASAAIATALAEAETAGLTVRSVVGAPRDVAALETALRRVGADDIAFVVGSAELAPGAEAILDRVARQLTASFASLSDVRVEIRAHTGDGGGPDASMALSQAQARAVRDYLVDRGVEGRRLVPVGRGDRDPIGDDSTSAGRSQNRRIELRVIG